eukprot:scaffold239141_cov48-Cyclotella_meneghiniana.AAC.1
MTCIDRRAMLRIAFAELIVSNVVAVTILALGTIILFLLIEEDSINCVRVACILVVELWRGTKCRLQMGMSDVVSV